jgi:hypothetical protein
MKLILTYHSLLFCDFKTNSHYLQWDYHSVAACFICFRILLMGYCQLFSLRMILFHVLIRVPRLILSLDALILLLALFWGPHSLLVYLI